MKRSTMERTSSGSSAEPRTEPWRPLLPGLQLPPVHGCRHGVTGSEGLEHRKDRGSVRTQTPGKLMGRSVSEGLPVLNAAHSSWMSSCDRGWDRSVSTGQGDVFQEQHLCRWLCFVSSQEASAVCWLLVSSFRSGSCLLSQRLSCPGL